MVAAVLAAAGVERTDIVASSLGVPLMIEWAARHPETVDRLVLYGGWARGADIGTASVRENIVGLVAGHWGLGAEVLTDIFASRRLGRDPRRPHRLPARGSLTADRDRAAAAVPPHRRD